MADSFIEVRGPLCDTLDSDSTALQKWFMAFNGFYGQEKRPGGTLTKDATKKNGHQTCRRLQESAQEFVFWGYKEKVDNRLAELNNS